MEKIDRILLTISLLSMWIVVAFLLFRTKDLEPQAKEEKSIQMSTASIEGDNLFIVVGESRIPADRIEIEAAPKQPGTILTAYSDGDIVTVYVDKDGEPCNASTVRYTTTKTAEGSKN